MSDKLPAPSGMYARFMDSGVNIVITFNTPTDLGLYDLGINFSCNEMFQVQNKDMIYINVYG